MIIEADLSGRGTALVGGGAGRVTNGVGVIQGGVRWAVKAEIVAGNATSTTASKYKAPTIVGLMLLLLFAVVY